MTRALCHALLGDHESALLDYDLALSLHPRGDVSLRGRALMHARLGHNVLALRDFDAVLQVDGLGVSQQFVLAL